MDYWPTNRKDVEKDQKDQLNYRQDNLENWLTWL